MFLNRNSVYEDDAPVFQVSQILLFSSAGITDNSEYGLLEYLDIHHFTDIAIFIDNTIYTQELTPRNTIRELSIYNINISATSTVGEKFLSYKNPFLHGRFAYLPPSGDVINFNVVTDPDDLSIDYNLPTFAADSSNPISLGYLNLGVVQNHNILGRVRYVFHDGSILRAVDVGLDDLRATVSFRIRIVNELGEEFFSDIVITEIAGNSALFSGNYIRDISPR